MKSHVPKFAGWTPLANVMMRLTTMLLPAILAIAADSICNQDTHQSSNDDDVISWEVHLKCGHPSIALVQSATKTQETNNDDGDNQLLEVCPDCEMAIEVPSSKVAVTFILSLVPTTPFNVLAEPISLATTRFVIFTGMLLIVIFMDAVMPPKVPVMVVTPFSFGTRPLLIPPQFGFEVKSATDVSFDENDTRL